jgi:hypothetical protein
VPEGHKNKIPGSLGCGSVVLARIATLAPSLAQIFAIASPIPLEPPVTTIVFPLKWFFGYVLEAIRSFNKLSLFIFLK